MADTRDPARLDDWRAKLDELELLNREMERNGWPVLISDHVASMYDVDHLEDLDGLVTASRRHLRRLAQMVAGLG
ncbi:MAG TPA: hypothetical protein VGH66_02865 [Acidimicrobiales bacterium]|jgi:hypothetical protein